ncbi:MAG: hypothetical protein H7Y19_12635 [Luteimonas sp.]|nr:hypothetical protein [Luteimonas sp.]
MGTRLGAVLSLPPLDGGGRVAAVNNASARWNVDTASYDEQILTALHEVEDQLGVAASRCRSVRAGARHRVGRSRNAALGLALSK